MTVGFRLDGDSRGLLAITERLTNLPERRQAALSKVIESGILHNYDALAWGGSIPTVEGGSIQWSRVRNRMTVAIRQSRGLGALFPILTLTGKLRRGLESGSSTANGGRFTYQVSGMIRELVRTHQYGLQPLQSLSSRFIFQNKSLGNRRVPARPIIFWSREMARQVQELAMASVKGGQA